MPQGPRKGVARSRSGRWESLGSAALALFCFFALWSTSGLYLALALILVAFASTLPAAWPVLRREPLFWLTLAFMLYVAARTQWAVYDDPELTTRHWKDARAMLWAFGVFVVLIGYWLAAARIRPWVYLALTGAGFVLGLGLSLRWDLVLQGQWAPYIFGQNPNLVAVYSGTIAIGMGVWLTSMLRHRPDPHIGALEKWAPRILAVLGFAAFGALTLYTGSRSGYLGAAVVSLLALVYAVSAWLRERRTGSSSWRSGVAVLGLLVLVFAIYSADPELPASRVIGAWQTLTGEVPSPAAEDIAVNLRLMMWAEAADAFAQRPLLGWGPAAAETLFPVSERESIRELSQFHNLYLEVAVGFGLLGLALMLGICALLFAGALRAWQGAPLRQDALAAFVLLAFVYFLVCAVSKIQINHPDGMAHAMLLGGFAYYLRLRPRFQGGKGDHRPPGRPTIRTGRCSVRER